MALAPARGQLRSIETENLRLVFYDPAHVYLAPQLMRGFENAFQFHRKIFGQQPRGKVTVLLEDFGDYGHGGADVIPSDRINIGIAPFNTIYETMPANERMSWVMNHELAHVFEMDGTRGSDRLFRRILGGKVSPTEDDPLSMGYGFLTTPRRYSPRWYHEGLAVFMETWMSGGLGRALGGYDEMVFRGMVRDNSRIFDVVGLESEGTTIDFQVGVNSYLYGTRFMTYLASQHGPEKVIQWAASGDGTRAYFSRQFRSVFGTSLQEEWSRWIASEKEWQAGNLSAIRQYPVTPVKRLSGTALGSVSRSFYDPTAKKIYAAVRYPGPMAHLAAIDPGTGTIEHLHDIEGAALFYVTSLAFDREGRKLYFTADNNDWRDLNVYDLMSHKSHKLITNFRGGDLAFAGTDRSLWSVRHANGKSEIAEVAPPYREFKTRFTFPYGTDVFQLDASPDGKWLSGTLADGTGRQRLVKFSIDKLRAGDGSYDVLHDFEFSSAEGFVFSPDGKKLYGTSYETGASNIFRVDASTGELEALSNSETGLFWPMPMTDNTLLAYEYTSQGFIPVSLAIHPIEDVSPVKYLGQQVVDKFPVVREWKLPPPEQIDVAQLTTSAGVYKPWRNMDRASLYPVIEGYKDSVAYGVRAELTDGLGLASLSFTGSYSPDSSLGANERAHFGLEYRNWGWKISASYNNADFYDLFGPTKVSRKGFAGRVGYKKSLLYKPPRSLDLEWNVAGYAGLDRLPDYQNVATPVDKFLTGRVSLTHSRLERSLGAVDDEKGLRWQIATQGNYAHSDFFPRVYGTFDYGMLTPLRNSPVWIRGSVGKSWGDSTDPFANFYFGGFGNNWVDHLTTSRYREYYSFPGVSLDQIGATDFAKTLVEWNLPPIRFRRFGTTWLYCNWARVTLFSSVLGTNLSSQSQVYGNLGTQADFRVVISSYLNTTFSTGYAETIDRTGRTSHGVMISLKLL